MTIARKGSRLLVVAGERYRWRVRHKPTYRQANGWSPMTVAVQRANLTGSVLVVELPGARPDSWVGEPVATVLPNQVAAYIQAALTDGWKAEQPGQLFYLKAD